RVSALRSAGNLAEERGPRYATARAYRDLRSARRAARRRARGGRRQAGCVSRVPVERGAHETARRRGRHHDRLDAEPLRRARRRDGRISHSALSWEVQRMLVLLTVASLALHSVADSSPFRALSLPTPTRIRSASGAPGPDYWQQEASYTIQATLDTAAQTLRGSERIHYVNHSPDSLAFVWMQVEQNLFAANSITYTLNQPPLIFAGGVSFDFTGKGFIGGGVMEKFEAAGKPLTRTPYGTMMRVELPAPLAPGAAIDFDVAWHFPIPPYGGGRM